MANNVLEITITIQPGFSIEALRPAIEDVINKTVDGFQQDYQDSVQHFEHKPAFHRQNAHWTGNVCEGSYGTATDWYVRLSEGWPAHPIGAGKLMSFYGYDHTLYGPSKAESKMKGVKVYKAKSIPGQIKSTPGYPMMGTQRIVRRGPFHVSAVEGRHYDVLIAQHNLPLFQRLANGIYRAIRKP